MLSKVDDITTESILVYLKMSVLPRVFPSLFNTKFNVKPNAICSPAPCGPSQNFSHNRENSRTRSSVASPGGQIFGTGLVNECACELRW